MCRVAGIVPGSSATRIRLVSNPSRPPAIGDVQRWLSAERFDPYLRAAGGDGAAALALYEWNVAAAGAFHEMLGQFEVLLRNAMHDQLTAWPSDAAGPGPGSTILAAASARSRLRTWRRPGLGCDGRQRQDG